MKKPTANRLLTDRQIRHKWCDLCIMCVTDGKATANRLLKTCSFEAEFEKSDRKPTAKRAKNRPQLL